MNIPSADRRRSCKRVCPDHSQPFLFDKVRRNYGRNFRDHLMKSAAHAHTAGLSVSVQYSSCPCSGSHKLRQRDLGGFLSILLGRIGNHSEEPENGEPLKFIAAVVSTYPIFLRIRKPQTWAVCSLWEKIRLSTAGSSEWHALDVLLGLLCASWWTNQRTSRTEALPPKSPHLTQIFQASS